MLTPLLEDERQVLRNNLGLSSIADLEMHLRVAISLGTLPDDLTEVVRANADEHVQEYVVQTLFMSLKKAMIDGLHSDKLIPSRLITALLLDPSFELFDHTVFKLMPALNHDQIVLVLRRVMAIKGDTSPHQNYLWRSSWMRANLDITSGSRFIVFLVERHEDELLVELFGWKKSDTNYTHLRNWISSVGLKAMRNCPKTVSALYDTFGVTHQTLITNGLIAIHPDVLIREQALDQLLKMSSREFITNSVYAPYALKPWRAKDTSIEELEKEVTKESLLKLFASDPSDKIRMMLVNGTNDRKTLSILKEDKNFLIASVAASKEAKVIARAQRHYEYHQRKKGEPVPTI